VKILEFKTVSPLFEMERDGIKPFTIRRIDKDSRFRALSQWNCEREWGIKITNPATGEYFIRRIKNVSYLVYDDISGIGEPGLRWLCDWRIITLGKLITGSFVVGEQGE